MVAWLCCFWACGKAEHGRIKPMAAEKQRGGGAAGFQYPLQGYSSNDTMLLHRAPSLTVSSFPILPQTGV